MAQITTRCDHSPRARYSGMQSQVDLRKHHYKQSQWSALNTPANLENSAVATGLEKVIFHSNSKERHCQKMFKLLYNCAHFTFQSLRKESELSFLCVPILSPRKLGHKFENQTRHDSQGQKQTRSPLKQLDVPEIS